MPDLAARLGRIDVAIAFRRAARDVADKACHGGEYEIQEDELDRLIGLRARVVRGHVKVHV